MDAKNIIYWVEALEYLNVIIFDGAEIFFFLYSYAYGRQIRKNIIGRI